MATVPVRQSSFGRGEVTPLAQGRTDHPDYARALKRLTNFFATPHAALKNRPGTKLVASTKGDGVAIYADFVFSSTQSYAIELGNLYARFDVNGSPVLSGGTGSAPYEIVTPFTTAMLPYLRWAQAGDILTLCYGGQDVAAIAPQELRRLGHTNWTIGAVSYAALVSSANTGSFPQSQGSAVVPDATHPARRWLWATTQLWKENATGIISETTPTYPVPSAYNAATTYAAGDVIFGSDAGLDSFWTSIVGANTGNPPTTSPTFWAQGIVVHADKSLKVLIGAAAKAGYTLQGFRVYQGLQIANNLVGMRFGFLQDLDATATFFTIKGDVPDYAREPPKSFDPFGTDYPSCVAFYEQRRIFGRQALHPRRWQGSRPGLFSNFDVDLIVQDDDAVSYDLDSSRFDEIRDLFHIGTLIALTQSGVWKIRGFLGEPLSPSSVDAKRDARVGASWVKATVAGNSVIFVRERGSGISEAYFDGNSGSWVVSDLSVFGSHLFEGHTIVSIAYAEEPHKILWAVRDDGVLLGCTRYGQDVLAWHKHTTDGVVEWVMVIPEGTEDASYMIVRRTINGVTKRYKERLSSRYISDIRTACFLDCAIAFDGRNVGAITMKFLSDSTYAGGEEGTITASAASFNTIDPSDVNDAIVLDPDGSAYSLTILSVTDATHARARLEKALPAAFQNVATTSWGWARDSFSGLDHLEAKSIKVLGDGGVQGPFTVAGGVIQGLTPVVLGTIGLSYDSLIEPLDIAQNKDKQKVVKAVAFELIESRGGWVGEDEDHLKEWTDQRKVSDAIGVPPLFTGMAKVRMQGSADTKGKAVFVQKDPLPCTIVGITREVEMGGSQ